MIFTRFMPLLLLVAFFACKNNPRIESPLIPNNLFVLEEIETIPDSLQSKFPEWIERGVKCYGLLIFTDNQGEFKTIGYVIPCKVVSFHLNGVKCKVLENIYPYESFGCQVIGVRKGTIWMETDGDLYLTEEEAQAALVTMRPKQTLTIER